MNILAFTDMHADEASFASLKKKVPKADIIICAGDFTIFEMEMKQWLKRLNALGRKVLIIYGNHETSRNLKLGVKPFANIIFMHKHALVVKDHLFMGYAGNGFVSKEPAFKKTSEKFRKLIKKHKKMKKVLVIHPPPYNTKLDNLYGEKVGNKSLRDFIDSVDLDLVICGHIHENEGKQDRLGKTRIVNPGPRGKILRIK